MAPMSKKVTSPPKLYIRRRLQFSSSLKRMSTVSSLPNGGTLVAVKGAPETIKTMLTEVPEWYDATYKWYSRRGSRVLALGTKQLEPMSIEKVVLQYSHCRQHHSWCEHTPDKQNDKGRG